MGVLTDRGPGQSGRDAALAFEPPARGVASVYPSEHVGAGEKSLRRGYCVLNWRDIDGRAVLRPRRRGPGFRRAGRFEENAMLLGLVEWVVVGVIVGFIASKVVNLRGDDPRLGMGAAVGGAVVAGILYAVISGAGVTPWSPWALVFAAIGGVVGVLGWHVVRSRSISKKGYVARRSY